MRFCCCGNNGIDFLYCLKLDVGYRINFFLKWKWFEFVFDWWRLR